MKKDKNVDNSTNETISVPLTSDFAEQESKEKDLKIEELNKKVSELEEKVKYGQAEIINYRKRKDEEVGNMLKFANQDLIVDLIPILDNFERALKFDESKLDDNQKKFLKGFEMLYNTYMQVLKKYGVEEIEAVGKDFDPMLHEAMTIGKDETKTNDTVLECLLKGYTLHGKVIRPSKVIVNQLDE